MYTDPSGYRYQPSGWVKGRDKYAAPVITAIISVLACNMGAVGCYAAINAASAVFTTLYRGGSISDALKAGLFSLASSALFYGAGQAADGIASEAIDAYLRGEIEHTTMQALVGAFGDGPLALGRIALHAAAGCFTSAISGADCGSGAASAAVGKAFQLAGASTEFGRSDVGGLIIAAIGGCAGGAAGSRGNSAEGCVGGAATAVAGYLFNQKSQSNRRGGRTLESYFEEMQILRLEVQNAKLVRLIEVLGGQAPVIASANGEITVSTIKILQERLLETVSRADANARAQFRRDEVVRIKLTDSGTYNWSRDQLDFIRSTGKLPEGYEIHHRAPIISHPELAGSQSNLQILSRPQHVLTHREMRALQ
jgi:GHH signature containing HNH/Endo VII superfamily nuclease toxin